MQTDDRHTVTILLDERCRALARVVALIEGRRLQVTDLRWCPATAVHARAEAVIHVTGPTDLVTQVCRRIEDLPGVVEVRSRPRDTARTVDDARPVPRRLSVSA